MGLVKQLGSSVPIVCLSIPLMTMGFCGGPTKELDWYPDNRVTVEVVENFNDGYHGYPEMHPSNISMDEMCGVDSIWPMVSTISADRCQYRSRILGYLCLMGDRDGVANDQWASSSLSEWMSIDDDVVDTVLPVVNASVVGTARMSDGCYGDFILAIRWVPDFENDPNASYVFQEDDIPNEPTAEGQYFVIDRLFRPVSGCESLPNSEVGSFCLFDSHVAKITEVEDEEPTL